MKQLKKVPAIANQRALRAKSGFSVNLWKRNSAANIAGFPLSVGSRDAKNSHNCAADTSVCVDDVFGARSPIRARTR